MPTLRDVSIYVGHTCKGRNLGCYYLDLRKIIPLVESGYHGPLDDRGVPLAAVSAEEHVYNSTTIGQYAIALHDSIVADGLSAVLPVLTAQLERLIRNIDDDGPWKGFCVHRWRNRKYREMPSPWVSALSQATAISALLRGHQLTGEGRLFDMATLLFEALQRPLEAGGVRVVDACGHLWFEEYPTTPANHVLNGFIFSLWGVLDFARVTDDARAWQWWEEGVRCLRAHLREFDSGYWSVYDLRYREPTSVYYHCNIHAPQLEAMYGLTGEELFQQYARRWRRFGRNPLCRAAQWIALRLNVRRALGLTRRTHDDS